MIDVRDAALQRAIPTVMVPRFGQFEPLTEPGDRYLAAEDGLWIESCRPGVYARQPVAVQKSVTMPYGRVSQKFVMEAGKLPKSFITDFIPYAQANCPREVARALIWNGDDKSLTSVNLEPISSSAGHINYRYPDLKANQHVIADIHSHGTTKAYFSPGDNKDDATDLKIAVVIGNVNSMSVSIDARVCVRGVYQKMDLAWLT